MSQGEFYLADTSSIGQDGKIKEEKNVLHFRLSKTGFDDRASREHIKNFEEAYTNFLAANPDFKAPWGEEPEGKFFAGNNILQPGDVTAEKVTGDEPHPDDSLSDDERIREEQEPSERGEFDVAPVSKEEEKTS